MAQAKLPIKDVLAAIDMNGKGVWKELTAEERKSVSFWLLNRYVSAVQGSRDDQELAVFKVNEYYNKHFNTIGVGKENGHQELMWQLLCMSGSWGKIRFHPYIGFKKKGGSNNKAIKLLERIHPNMKTFEVEMLADMYSTKELKQLAEDYNIESKL